MMWATVIERVDDRATVRLSPSRSYMTRSVHPIAPKPRLNVLAVRGRIGSAVAQVEREVLC
jgi:hypothetical protein